MANSALFWIFLVLASIIPVIFLYLRRFHSVPVGVLVPPPFPGFVPEVCSPYWISFTLPYILVYLHSELVLVDLETHKLLGLAPGRKQSEIEKVMRLGGDKVLSQLEEISMDMSYNYKSLVNKLCPNASVTVDRFHVTKMIH